MCITKFDTFILGITKQIPTSMPRSYTINIVWRCKQTFIGLLNYIDQLEVRVMSNKPISGSIN